MNLECQSTDGYRPVMWPEWRERLTKSLYERTAIHCADASGTARVDTLWCLKSV